MVVFIGLNSWIGLYARLSFFVMFSIISRGVSAGLPTATAPNLAIKIKKESVSACFFLFFLAKRECRGRPHNRRDTYIIITPVAGRAGVACDKRRIHVGATFMSPGWRRRNAGRAGWWRGIKWDKRRGDIHVARMAGACMRAVALPPCGRPGVTSGAPTCGRFGWRVGGVWAACGVAAVRFGWCALYAVRAGCV